MNDPLKQTPACELDRDNRLNKGARRVDRDAQHRADRDLHKTLAPAYAEADRLRAVVANIVRFWDRLVAAPGSVARRADFDTAITIAKAALEDAAAKERPSLTEDDHD